MIAGLSVRCWWCHAAPGVRKRARRECAPIADTIEAAILAALDDAERFPTRQPGWRQRRKPMVAHAHAHRSTR